MFIRLNLYLIRSDNDESDKIQYLKFLKYRSNEKMVKKYGFKREDAISYNKIVYYLINISKINEICYLFGVAFLILRILIVAALEIDLK